jgi:hypothetical protein
VAEAVSAKFGLHAVDVNLHTESGEWINEWMCNDVYDCMIVLVPRTLSEERRLRVLENRVLRGILGPTRVEVTGDWRKLHNEELNGLYCLPNIVRMIKSRRMRWAEYVERMGRGEAYTGFLWGDLRETDY